MREQPHTENNVRYHTENIGRMMKDLSDHLREDVGKIDDPQAKALFEVSAEVIEGLQRSFDHFESHSEKAWRK